MHILKVSAPTAAPQNRELSLLFCRSRWGAGVSRGLREDGGSVDRLAQLGGQVQSEQRGFEVTEDWTVFKGLRGLQ